MNSQPVGHCSCFGWEKKKTLCFICILLILPVEVLTELIHKLHVYVYMYACMSYHKTTQKGMKSHTVEHWCGDLYFCGRHSPSLDICPLALLAQHPGDGASGPSRRGSKCASGRVFTTSSQLWPGWDTKEPRACSTSLLINNAPC